MHSFLNSTTANAALPKILLRVGLCLAVLAGDLLRAAPVEAGSISLTGLLPAYTLISQVAISPDSKYVVYTADIEADNQRVLYSVPITGTVPVRLSSAQISDGSVGRIIITPDSGRLIYTADQEEYQRWELYSVPIAGGEVIKLNWPLPAGGDVLDFRYDQGTGQVIYIADQDINDAFMLYTVAADNPETLVNLTPSYSAGSRVYTFEIDPVSSRVIWSGKSNADEMYELYSTPILGGGGSVKLNQPVYSGVFEFSLTPGIAYVMYTAIELGSSKTELFGIDTTGGTTRKRSGTLGPGESVTGFSINPTGSQVVFTVATNSFIRGSLRRASPFSGPVQHLSEAPDMGYGAFPESIKFSPDGNRAVYKYQKNGASLEIIQSVFISGGALLRVDLFATANGFNATINATSPDSQMVVVSVSSNPAPAGGEMYVLRIDRDGNAVAHGNGLSPFFTPDSQRLIYTNAEPSLDQSDVISDQILGGNLRNLSQTQSQDDAHSPQISPDGKWIVYKVDIDNGSSHELRASDGTVTLDAAPTPTTTPEVFFNFVPMIGN